MPNPELLEKFEHHDRPVEETSILPWRERAELDLLLDYGWRVAKNSGGRTPTINELVERVRIGAQKLGFPGSPKGANKFELNKIYLGITKLDPTDLVVNGQKIYLTPTEYLLLRRFIQTPEVVVGRQKLLDLLGQYTGRHTLHANISRIRKKLSLIQGHIPFEIVNERKQGFLVRRVNPSSVSDPEEYPQPQTPNP